VDLEDPPEVRSTSGGPFRQNPCRMRFLFSIPSPHTGTLGPIHMYGLMLLLAIAAAIWLTGIRWVRLGGDWDMVFRVAVWGVAFGIVGARLYHDVTSYGKDPAIHAHWWGWFAVWKGGLGVWGGIGLGVVAGAVVVRSAGQSIRLFMDAVAPGLLLAQAVGRWGNWWNQELYGKPTSLPWGLKIDPAHRPSDPKYFANATYHPTFLYEFLYNLLGVLLLLWVGKRFRIKPPALFALYVSIYTFGRFFEELLRIDPAYRFAGLRLNAWVSVVGFVLSTGFFVWWQFFRRAEPGDRPRARKSVTPAGPAMAVPKGRVRPGR
jgi:prolipoprotein diacylglyceryl transferase